MALIQCEECGKEYSDKADSCPSCGNPNPQKQSINVVAREKEKGFWSAGRLAIGIVSIVFSVLVLFQSCAVGIGEALEESGDTGSGAGVICFLAYLVCGIVGIVTRNLKSKAGSIITSVLYILNGLIAVSNAKVYQDLQIWGILSFIFGIVFIICAVKTKKD